MKHLVMLGTGHAHVHLLSTLSAEPLAGVQITLITPYARELYKSMTPEFVSGNCSQEDCAIALDPILKNSSINWLQRDVVGLDAEQRTITLDNGSLQNFDVLSINIGPAQSRQRMDRMIPGAREHALFLHPVETFFSLWPKVAELATHRPLRVAILGSDAAAFELACTVGSRLFNASVTLISGDTPVGAHYPQSMQLLMRQTLKERHITVIQESVVRIAAGELTLASGARLICDVPLITTGTQAPDWIQNSGLAMDTQGFVAVDGFQRSTSHRPVFVADDIATRADDPLPRDSANAMRDGKHLSKNLRAVLAGIEPTPFSPQRKTLIMLSCGKRQAIVSWGNWSAQGRWVWQLKNWLDRAAIRKYSNVRSTRQ